jgi:hypothetical protein
VTDALAALRAYAFTRGRPLGDVAADVLGRRVRLAADAENGHAGPVARTGQPEEDGGDSVDPDRQPGNRQEED